MTPEAKAREKIDTKLIKSGWIIQDMSQINPIASLGVAVREYPTSTGPADYILFIDGGPVGGIEVKKDKEPETEESMNRWENNLFNFFTKITPKLTEDLKKPFKLEGIQRIDETPVYKAVREAFVNLIIHADYLMDAGVLKVIKKSDGFEFTNPEILKLPLENTSLNQVTLYLRMIPTLSEKSAESAEKSAESAEKSAEKQEVLLSERQRQIYSVY